MAESNRPIDPEVVRLNTLRFSHRIKVGEALERAQIAPSTWARWKEGAEPRLQTLRRFEAAVVALIQEKELADGSSSRTEDTPAPSVT